MRSQLIITDSQSGPDKYNGTYPNSNGGTELMYRGLMSRLSDEYKKKYQIICSRVREFEPNKKAILWCHDYWSDPENSHLENINLRKRFAKIVFVSNHQFNQYRLRFGIKYDESIILKNAIEPISETKILKPTSKIKIIYHTTPHRGLHILVAAFKKLAEIHPHIELDIFSSFNVYGWTDKDQHFEQIFEECRQHPRINYYGTVSNDEVKVALSKAHIFAYPSIHPETSCISAIEAMSAGCVIVCPDFEVLPETARYAITYRWSENQVVHLERFTNRLHETITYWENIKKIIEPQKKWADHEFAWDNRILEWENLLKSLD